MPVLKKGSKQAKEYMAKIRAMKNKRIASTLYLEKNEKVTDPIKRSYRIERDPKGRIKKYSKVNIEDAIIYKTRKTPKEKFFYKSIFENETGKRKFEKYKVVEQFDAFGFNFFRTTGDKSFTEGKTGLSYPNDLYNIRDFKTEILKGSKGAFATRLEQTQQMIENSIKQYGLSPLYK
jgi:hypothetical protein